MKITSIRESKFIFTVEKEAFNRFIVVVDVRVGDQSIYPIHLHRDFSVDRYLAANYRVTKLTVVSWSRRIR
jgi:hypothetical protein